MVLILSKHFSALISHTLATYIVWYPDVASSFKDSSCDTSGNGRKEVETRSSPSLRVLSKNEMDLSSQNRFRLKETNSKILPMLPSAPKPPAIPPPLPSSRAPITRCQWICEHEIHAYGSQARRSIRNCLIKPLDEFSIQKVR